MKLSTGKVAFPIEFDNGDREVICFNPNDAGIQERISNFERSIENRVKQIDLEKYRNRFDDNKTVNFDIDNIDKLLEMSDDEISELQNRLSAVIDIEREYNISLRAELDNVFDSDISNVAFKYCQPLDVVVSQDEKGVERRELYIIHFLRWLMVELGKYGEKNKSAIDKHISKYQK